jgi:hypothetical protein
VLTGVGSARLTSLWSVVAAVALLEHGARSVDCQRHDLRPFLTSD